MLFPDIAINEVKSISQKALFAHWSRAARGRPFPPLQDFRPEERLHDPKQLVFALDHDIQNKDEANQKKYRSIEAFAKEHGIDFYPAGSGIGHQIMVERGYVVPGSFVVSPG